MHNIIVIRRLIQLEIVAIAIELYIYLSTVANTQDCASQMPKMLLWTTIKQNSQICVNHAPSCIHFCKKKHTQKGMVAIHFLSQS